MSSVIEMCNKLWDYEYKGTLPIVIVAPDCTQKNKLRVYANGGRLGKISFGGGKTELLNPKYDEYLPQKGFLKGLIEKAIEGHTENDTFINTKYLKNAIEAIEARFRMKEKKKDEDVVKEQDVVKERYVETAIVRKYMRRYVHWAVIDMEAQFPRAWFPNANFSKNTTKSQKTERQLLIYEILYTSHEVTIDELIRRLGTSKRTIQRDIEDLTDAGLIKLTYSRKDKSYKHEDATGVISEPEGTHRYIHLKKLRRLAIFMYIGNGHIAIDCGCIYGGRLAAYCIETGAITYAEAKGRYL